MPENNVNQVEFRVNGEDLIAKVKELLHEGNIRRLIIKNQEGVTMLEIPLTFGLVGAALLPVWAAIGGLAALATSCTIVVEKTETPETSQGNQAGNNEPS